MILLIATALAADSLGGLALGSTFNKSEWHIQSDGAYAKKATVGGLDGILTPSVCRAKITSVTFYMGFANVKSADWGMVQVPDPYHSAETARKTLSRALAAAGYASHADGAFWTKGEGATFTSRYLSATSCTAQAGGLVTVCSISMTVADPAGIDCTEGL